VTIWCHAANCYQDILDRFEVVTEWTELSENIILYSLMLVCCCVVGKVKSDCFYQCKVIVCVQHHCAATKEDGLSAKDTRTCEQDQTQHLPVEPEQNGFCKTDLWQDLKINGLKMNGHCTSTKGNGIIKNGHIKNGQCLVSDHSVKNGFQKNGHWKVMEDDVRKNGHCGVFRHRKDSHDSTGGSSVLEENSIDVNEQYTKQSTSQSQDSHASEHVESNHIKVSF